MNITIVSNILPYPLNSGGAQAQFNMINELRHIHKITFVFTQDGRNTLSAMHDLEKLWPEVTLIPFLYVRQMLYPKFLKDKICRFLKLKFTPEDERFKVERTLMPYGVYFSKDFVSFVNKIIKKTNSEIVQVEFFPCLHLVNYLPNHVRKIFVHHELRFVRNERLLQNFNLTDKEKLQKEQVKSQELSDLNKYDDIITLTSVDREILIKEGVKTTIHTSPAAISANVLPYKEWNGKITFVGGYGHIPNQEGIEWFLNDVTKHFSKPEDIKFELIGGGWPSIYSKSNVDITLRGFVDSLQDAAWGSIMIVPILTGSGMRMKILEAAAMSLPFVTTSVGVEGLDFVDGESCLICNSPQDFAHAIERLTKDAELCRKLGQNARSVYDEKYSVQKLSSIRDNIYKL
ncbi:MAG: glycosyltransferase family 4 protein [Bacteroidaceae bacterium]|nr:glycosyltransferase family 4 protein [Bacteroidaceae bacterium]